MTTVRTRLGIIASDECKRRAPDQKPWFHVRRFVKQYKDLLDQCEIWATEGTANIISEEVRDLQAESYNSILTDFEQLASDQTNQPVAKTVSDIRKNVKSVLPLELKPLGQTATGVVKLAAMVAKGEIDRVLFFEDPADVETHRPENYALLRNCDLKGTNLCINEAARLWAEDATNRMNGHPRVPQLLGDPETVVFIAHDRRKDDMAKFVLQNRHILQRFHRRVATAGTKKRIDKELNWSQKAGNPLNIEAAGGESISADNIQGGDVIIASEIFDKCAQTPRPDAALYHIIFFIDHKITQSHDSDIQVLLRTCANPELRVNLMLASQLACEWIKRYDVTAQATTSAG